LSSGDALNSIACPTKASCLAVSDGAVASVKSSNGALKITATPKRPKVGIVALNVIACAGSKVCYAVGFEGTELQSKATVVRLSAAGKILSVLSDKGTGIGGIACPSSTQCLVSDFADGKTSIQVLSGTHFGASHTLPANTYVDNLSCFGTKVCYALAGNNKSVPARTDEVFSINPGTGAVGKEVTLRGFDGDGMTCASANTCVVVGFTGEGLNLKPAMIVIAKGKPGKAKNLAGESLAAVACASATLCYAVGLGSTEAIVEKV
jgi:hypothetical protein